ncbi:MAG TPA: HD domain-containing protein [Clostridia bacterium]|nr:HD domain-containing protein [Clostridia bacterium]
MTEQIRKTLDFVKKKLLNEYDKTFFSKEQMTYRYEHTLRVAAIGQKIARAEKMNEEALIIACLLHDVGYCEISDPNQYNEHGFISAKVAKPFVNNLDCDEKTKLDILAGIASHVTDEADFPCELNAFTKTVGDCDNIDRFDVFRIYDNLQDVEYRDMPLDKQKDFAEKRLTKLEKFEQIQFATITATKMWQEKIKFQIIFYKRLLEQLNQTIE